MHSQLTQMSLNFKLLYYRYFAAALLKQQQLEQSLLQQQYEALRYFDPYLINHYNLINTALQMKKLGEEYHKKYPNSQTFINLNDELFTKNPEAKSEYINVAKKQRNLKNSIISDLTYICKQDNCANYEICSGKNKLFFIEQDYHIEQNLNLLIETANKDINKK
jgi:hypothetical protein